MGRVSAANASLRRFESADIDPAQAVELARDHPAVVEARTIFPSTVVGPDQSPRFLVSGHNNPKLGKEVTKGERAGWPIFQLTLEERATCPRSCAQWRGCYGNAMHRARRHDHRSPEFMTLLRGEIATAARQHPAGLLIRLHTLGDFFSAPYVLMWGEMLLKFPQLHVFGYTSRRTDDAADPESQKIAQAIDLLRSRFWSRFAIRTSHAEPGPERSIVVDQAVSAPDVIMCPAQVKATEACATCGLCWADAARPKTIAFLRHGMKRTRSPRQPSIQEAPLAQLQAVDEEDEDAATIRALNASGMKLDRIAAILQISLAKVNRVLAPSPAPTPASEDATAEPEEPQPDTAAALAAETAEPPPDRAAPDPSEPQRQALRIAADVAAGGWTEARVNLAKKLALEGVSASGIAKQLGGVTRNAVIGKLRRMDITLGGGQASAPAQRPAARRAPPQASRVRLAVEVQPGAPAAPPRLGAPVGASLPAELPPLHTGEPVSLLDLPANGCKWPIGDPRHNNFGFCAALREGDGPYCVKHDRLAYNGQGRPLRAPPELSVRSLSKAERTAREQ